MRKMFRGCMGHYLGNLTHNKTFEIKVYKYQKRRAARVLTAKSLQTLPNLIIDTCLDVFFLFASICYMELCPVPTVIANSR